MHPGMRGFEICERYDNLYENWDPKFLFPVFVIWKKTLFLQFSDSLKLYAQIIILN